MSKFSNRQQAGKQLVEELDTYPINFDIVLALPRGGVPIGVEIAQALQVPLNVFIARKLGSPNNPEFGIGAIAEPNIVILDPLSVEQLGVSDADLREVIGHEEQEMKRRIAIYRQNNPLPELTGLNVLLVDDGVATGVTANAAIQGVKEYNPSSITFASPVCSDQAYKVIADQTDNAICLITPIVMRSVGQFYNEFQQVTDEDVIRILESVNV